MGSTPALSYVLSAFMHSPRRNTQSLLETNFLVQIVIWPSPVFWLSPLVKISLAIKNDPRDTLSGNKSLFFQPQVRKDNILFLKKRQSIAH
jgi:hypothetical protein